MQHLNVEPTHFETRDSEDRVFRDLDNRRIGIGSESRTAQVFGVHMIDHEGWVQVAFREDPSESVVVHIMQGTTAGQIALALSKWALTPVDERPILIEARPIDAH
jgi:hypothetical protein